MLAQMACSSLVSSRSSIQARTLILTGKNTLARLNATPEETEEREQKMAEAIRTILEGIGEDPDREGLQRTPLRYAKALLWMTRGYEERLSGACPLFFTTTVLTYVQM